MRELFILYSIIMQDSNQCYIFQILKCIMYSQCAKMYYKSIFIEIHNLLTVSVMCKFAKYVKPFSLACFDFLFVLIILQINDCKAALSVFSIRTMKSQKPVPFKISFLIFSVIFTHSMSIQHNHDSVHNSISYSEKSKA